ncbi:hypothetical protein HUJ04_011362 [Dendroctonus ponderosae]|nr:hypothetical protein HUJ04_011362 [Dendroctonus ponderosae]
MTFNFRSYPVKKIIVSVKNTKITDTMSKRQVLNIKIVKSIYRLTGVPLSRCRGGATAAILVREARWNEERSTKLKAEPELPRPVTSDEDNITFVVYEIRKISVSRCKPSTKGGHVPHNLPPLAPPLTSVHILKLLFEAPLMIFTKVQALKPEDYHRTVRVFSKSHCLVCIVGINLTPLCEQTSND